MTPLPGTQPWRSGLHNPVANRGTSATGLCTRQALVDQTTPALLRNPSDTVGELVGYAASAAKREMRVGASGRPVNQAVTRSRLRAAAVATCCRRVLARPR